jgi:voltage-gated potassium channel
MLWEKRLKAFSKLFIPFFLLGATIIFGITGYMIIEHYTFLEAVYMTVITVSTVGFGEVRYLSNAGQVFTIILILLNIGVFSYFITIVSRYFLDGDFIRNYKLLKMGNSINKLKDHVIICGFGRNGKETAQVFFDNKIPFVVIEKNDSEKHADFQVDYFIRGDATQDETMLEAGIKNAKAVISTLPLDTDNLFVVLTAKQLNKNISVISRASKDTSVDKLKIAGANNVIMPDKIGGAHMATLVMIPDVVEVLSLMSTRNNTDFKVIEMAINKSFVLHEIDLWRTTGCTVLALKKESSEYLLNPPHSSTVGSGDSLIIMGSDEQLNRARAMV